MKRKLFIIIAPIVSVLSLVTTIIIGYSWYVNIKRIGNIDAETKDISFIYYFDSKTNQYNQLEYSVSNVSFFDGDSTTEVSYLDDMICVVTIYLENTTKDDITYSIEYDGIIAYTYAHPDKYDSAATYYSDQEGTATDDEVTEENYSTYYIKTSEAFCEGILSTTNSITVGTSATVDAYFASLDSPHSISGSLSGASNGVVSDTTVYLILYGIQRVDSATNDFLSESYNFTLTFSAQSNVQYEETTREVTTETSTETE